MKDSGADTALTTVMPCRGRRDLRDARVLPYELVIVAVVLENKEQPVVGEIFHWWRDVLLIVVCGNDMAKQHDANHSNQ